MTYSITVYAFEDQLIYTAALNLYFDRYKGKGKGGSIKVMLPPLFGERIIRRCS